MSHEQDDMPLQVKWIMNFINRIGFPILVCIWLAYTTWIQGKETMRTLNDFRDVMMSMKSSIDEQNKILRRQNRRDD